VHRVMVMLKTFEISETCVILDTSRPPRQPNFFRGGPRGLGIDTSKPLTSHALTGYLTQQGFALGYNNRISFHSICRRAATNLVRALGTELAQEIKDHAPESCIAPGQRSNPGSKVMVHSVSFLF